MIGSPKNKARAEGRVEGRRQTERWAGVEEVRKHIVGKQCVDRIEVKERVRRR